MYHSCSDLQRACAGSLIDAKTKNVNHIVFTDFSSALIDALEWMDEKKKESPGTKLKRS
jgi:hypothetical protein